MTPNSGNYVWAEVPPKREWLSSWPCGQWQADFSASLKENLVLFVFTLAAAFDQVRHVTILFFFDEESIIFNVGSFIR